MLMHLKMCLESIDAGMMMFPQLGVIAWREWKKSSALYTKISDNNAMN